MNRFNIFHTDKTEQNATLGITFFVIAVFLIVAMNACAKAAMAFHYPIEALFYRSLIAMVFLLVLAKISQTKDIFKTKHPLKHLKRSIVGNISVFLVFWSYSILPMADVTALLFVSPLIVTSLSPLLLKEQIGIYRWSAVIMGFTGVLFITQPFSNGIDSLGISVVLAAAFTTALVSIFLRDMGQTENSLTTVFYFLAGGIFISGIYMVFNGRLPHPDAFWPLMGAGLAAGIQLVMKTQAYKMAEASLLSPLNYSSIIWATLFGWLFWNEIPTSAVIIGATIIISGNLIVIRREQKSIKARL